MNNKYKYSMDLSSYFAEKAVEDTTPEVADQGIMKRNPSKAAATETTQEAYDPYSFMPKFAEALKASFGDPEQGKRFIGSMADQPSEDVRLREVESYMSDLTRRNAIEDVLISLMPNEPQSFPSAGTLGEPEGTETLPGVPAVSTSPLGPQMATPALNLDAPIDIAPVDPTIMDYATESDLSAIEELVDSLMLESRDDKEVAAETPEEREQYRGKGKGLMSKKLDGKDGDLDAYKFKDKDVVTAALDIGAATDDISKDSVIKQVREVVGDNAYAAGILGAFTAESGSNFNALEENMNYSLSNAQSVFSQSKIDNALQSVSPEVRQKILAGGRDPAFGEALMSHYGGGGRYHGRGLIHITHDYNYRAVGDKIGVDLVSNPDLVKDPRYAVPAAIAFLEMNGYFKGSKPTKDSLHRIINPGAPTSVKNKRWKAAQDYLKSFKTVPETSVRPKARSE